jgi:hypothetical protein
MNNWEAMAEAIKNLEPELRLRGDAPDWELFNQQFQAGMFSDEITLQQAIDNSKRVKV